MTKLALLIALLVALAVASPSPSRVQCTLCEVVASRLEDRLAPNATLADLKREVAVLCSSTPMGALCGARVEPLLERMLKPLVERQLPRRACEEVRLCTAKSGGNSRIGQVSDTARKALQWVARLHEGVQHEDVQHATAKRTAELALDVEDTRLRCSACEFVITYEHMSGPPTQAKVQQLVTLACAKIPFAKDACVQFVAPVVAQVTADLLKNMDSQRVCERIKLCNV